MRICKSISVILFLSLSILAQPINLRGTISNQSGKPIANAIITLLKQGLKDTTGINGTYTISSTTAIVAPVALQPLSRSITLENGFLELRLTSPSPVKVEIFDVNGSLLQREIHNDATQGFYRFSINKNFQTTVLLIRIAIGKDEYTYRFLPLKGTCQIRQTRNGTSSVVGRFAKLAAITDTLKVTAPGFLSKTVEITNYDQLLDISLDTASGNAGYSSGCGKTPTLKSGKQTIQVSGQSRDFMIRIPDNYNNTHPYRLVFAFHWRGGNMNDIDGGGTSGYSWSYYGLREQANNSTIFVAPNGIGGGWGNDGGRDLKFVDEMLKLIKGDLCIDTTRIFAMGFSWGGGMSYAIACDRPKVFRAVAVYAGAVLSSCLDGTLPIAYLGIHGVSDGTCGIAGGRALRDKFVKNNGCTPENPPEPKAGSRAAHICTVYKGCNDKYPVEWCAFDGDHTPGNVDGGGDDGAKTWTKKKAWEFFTQF
jgi:poly(3-hydroxybutyrate) depolymerase